MALLAGLLSSHRRRLLVSSRALRGPHKGHDAADVQEEKVVVQGRLLQPAEKGAGEEVRDPEIRHQTGQKAAGGHARPDRRAGRTPGDANATRRLKCS